MLNSSDLSNKAQNTANLTCWVITEGMIGTQNQCVGVAEILQDKYGISYDIKQIGLRQPWKSLCPWLGFEMAYTFTTPLVPSPNSSWPDIVIAAGRKSIAAARYIKKQNPKTFTVQIQDPKTNPNQFDLVAVPHHDKMRGQNVIVTHGAPNRLTPQKLVEAKKKFAPLFEKMPAPRVAVLIGGNSRTHKMSADVTKDMVQNLQSLNASLMITTSRRTGEENLKTIQKSLNNKDNFIWDGNGDNPYFGMLAWADYIVVTSDSVSMLSDAGTTGKPVYVVDLEGESDRFNKLHQHFQDIGVSRPLSSISAGNLEAFSYEPLNDANIIANAIITAIK